MEMSVNYSQKYINQPMPMLVVLTTTMTSSPSNEKRSTKEFLHYTWVYKNAITLYWEKYVWMLEFFIYLQRKLTVIFCCQIAEFDDSEP